MFSAYVISAQGAVSKRITGAAPGAYELLQRCPELGRSGIKKNPVPQNSILPQWDLCGAFLSEKNGKSSSDKKFVFHIFYAMMITAAHLFFGRCAAES